MNTELNVLEKRELKYSISSTSIDFTSNSYLNLHTNPNVIDKSIEYIKKFGTSFTMSPLIGRCELYEELFSILENIYQKQNLIFPSGYQLNSTVIPTIINIYSNPIVFYDRLNHASMNQGLLISKKQFHRYRNCDMNHLEFFLKKYENSNRQMFVFTESIFSMDGTMIDIENLIFLKRKYNFFLYIDEAHSLGIYGENGYGISYKYKEEIDIIMGTFSKGIGSQGAFISTQQEIFNYLINHCHGLIYSTGLSPSNIGATCSALNILKNMNKDRKNIENISKYFCKKLNILNHNTHIIPIIFNDLDKAYNKYSILKDKNINVALIKYPTVAKNLPRLRFCINNNHQIENIDQICNILK